MSNITLTEHQEQASFFQEVGYRFRNNDEFIPELLYAVPNGIWAAGDKDDADGKSRATSRKFALIAKYKAEGMKKGIADIHYDFPRGGYTKFVCEMKRSDKRGTKDGGLKPEQITYLNAVRKAGAFVCVCYSAEEAVDQFVNYMGMNAEKMEE